MKFPSVRLCASLALLAMCAAAAAQEQPWRLGSAMKLPDALTLSGEHRIRFESLDNQFRGGRTGGDQILAFRTLLFARLQLDRIAFAGEVLDARAALADGGTPVSTSDVNPLELLQAYAEIPLHDIFGPGSRSVLRAGRMTMDSGSRRLVARNRYRNTINAFTGADWQWTGTDQDQVRLFYTLPVQRRAGQDLLHAEPEFDAESGSIRFWGATYAPHRLPWGDSGEFFVFGLKESDTATVATRNRNLQTAGLRLFRPAAPGRLDYEVESVFQIGESRASTAGTDTTDLDHFAHFQHAEIGYSFETPWRPRVLLQYDYASGDDDPFDGDNNQFDTLYGARRFDFGPTGIYGPFARANISSPGVRVHFQAAPPLKGFVALRGFWLASDRDAWTTARIQDPGGNSGDFVGTQIELRVQWEPMRGNLQFESGVAHIFGGEFMASPPGNGNGDPTYVYLQSVLTF